MLNHLIYIVCGCFLQIANKKRIVECIMLYDALHKRRIYLDAFASGLEVFGMKKISFFLRYSKSHLFLLAE